MLINKKCFEQHGLYDESMLVCEDWDREIAFSSNFMAVHIPEDLVIMRVHKKNSTNSRSKDIWEQNWAKVRQKLIARTQR